jgi:hypothetical protein
MDRASAAQRHPAAEFRPGEPGNVAQKPQQRHVGIAVKCLFLPVYLQPDHGSSNWFLEKGKLATNPGPRQDAICSLGPPTQKLSSHKPILSLAVELIIHQRSVKLKSSRTQPFAFSFILAASRLGVILVPRDSGVAASRLVLP